MRELEERENRAGYQRELEERLALGGCTVARDAMRRRETLAQVPDPDEDLDEDELEDEEELLHQVVELEGARFILDALDLSRAGDVTGGKE